VPAEWNISARNLMDLKRDHYEGTDIDLTLGVFAGPFRSPNRLEGGIGMKENGGQFARAISLPRTSYSTVGQSYGRNGVGSAVPRFDKMWFASDTPASSVFVPFYAQASTFAPAYRIGNMNVYNEHSAWWVFDFVANWMEINYDAMEKDVSSKLNELQDYVDLKLHAVEYASGHSAAANIAELERVQETVQQHVVDSWRTFGHYLIVKYNDGLVNLNGLPVPLGYPAWWLQMFGLNDDIRPKWGMPSLTPPSDFSSMNPASLFLAAGWHSASGDPSTFNHFTTLAGYGVMFLTGWYCGRCGRQSDSDYRVAPS